MDRRGGNAGPAALAMDAAFARGAVHAAAEDTQAAIEADADTLGLWQSLTPLGRNGFICWVEDAKKAATRARRIERTREERHEGKRRPYCWAGCVHRPDKPPSPSQQAVMIGRKERHPTSLADGRKIGRAVGICR